jgi:hypothetical protein
VTDSIRGWSDLGQNKNRRSPFTCLARPVEPFRAFERLKSMWRSVLLGVVLTGVLAGCSLGGGSRPAGDQGVEGTLQAPIPIRWMKQVAKWESELRSAEHDSRYSYPTPSLPILETRIAAASRRFGFRVVALRFVRAPQGSPMLIVQPEGSPSSFAPKVGKIVGLLNHVHRGGADWNSTAYEGFSSARRTAAGTRSCTATTSSERGAAASGHALQTSTPSRTAEILRGAVRGWPVGVVGGFDDMVLRSRGSPPGKCLLVSVATRRRLSGHAGFGSAGFQGPSIAECTGLRAERDQLGEAVSDFLAAMQRLNIELNGDLPSGAAAGKAESVPRDVAYAVSEVARMLRADADDARAAEVASTAARQVDAAWSAVLAGDIDDIEAHLVDEGLASRLD